MSIVAVALRWGGANKLKLVDHIYNTRISRRDRKVAFVLKQFSPEYACVCCSSMWPCRILARDHNLMVTIHNLDVKLNDLGFFPSADNLFDTY